MLRSLQIGKMAPNFITVGVYKNQLGKVRLSDYRGKKYVVLIFYPANFTSISTSELLRLNDFTKELRKLSTQILAISLDSPFSHLQFLLTVQSQKRVLYLDYPLVSDLTQKITSQYRVLNDQGICLPGVYIIDKDGIIQYYTVYNLLCGRNIGEIISILKSIQFLKENPRKISRADWTVYKYFRYGLT